MRSLFLLLLSTVVLSTAFGQQEYERKLNRLFDKLASTSKDTAKARVLCEIADVYYTNRQIIPHWTDNVLRYTAQALDLSKKAGYSYGQWQALWIQMRLYLFLGNHQKAMALTQQANDTNAINTLWQWGIYYSNPGLGMKVNYDSAYYFCQQALLRSEKSKLVPYISYSHGRLAVIYCWKYDTASALREATLAASYYKGPNARIATMWHEMGISFTLTEKNFPFKMACYERSLAIFQQLGNSNQLGIGRVYMSMGDIDNARGQRELAERNYVQAERLLKEVNDNRLYLLYLRLHDIYYYKGNYAKSVHNALEALKSAEADGIRNLNHYYLYIGNSYLDMGQASKSIEYYNKAFASARTSDKQVSGVLIKRMARAMVADGKAREGLAFVQEACREFVAPLVNDSIMKCEAMAICYMALKQYDEAEKYYLQMNALSSAAAKPYAAVGSYAIGKFYYETRQYDKAMPYLNNCLGVYRNFLPVVGISETSLLLYRIDSARQQYQSALTHLQLHKTINDSLFTTAKNRQIEELRVQYDIENKDQALLLQEKDIELLTRQKLLQQSLAEQKSKDVLLKQQDIDLLTQQTSLQQMTTEKQELELVQKEKDLKLQGENINLLRNREQLQQAQLEQANFAKKMTIAGIALLVVIVGLLYNQYRIKQRNNREISNKNEKLHNLLDEKEWLLKEVHHRVKNNLQVVLSLLQSQSTYLKDEALAAVHDSQHRVQAMSLIHQKLYQSDNISTINMEVYIPELVEYLKDSFVTRTRMTFILDVTPVALDVTQAIPLGLILNEAVTNIFKHAFPDRERGHVNISLKALNNAELVLDIADNGIGLPPGAEHSSRGSLGMSLMKGLSRDFNARYTIERKEGTHIQVVFPRELHLMRQRQTI